MCGISAIYILDKKGRVLISRHFRPDLPTNIYDVFNKKILEYDEYTLKYFWIEVGPSSRTGITICSTSTSTTISIWSPSPRKITMLLWSSPSFTNWSRSWKATSRMSRRSPSGTTLLSYTNCSTRWWTMDILRLPRSSCWRVISKLSHMSWLILSRRRIIKKIRWMLLRELLGLSLGDLRGSNTPKMSFSLMLLKNCPCWSVLPTTSSKVRSLGLSTLTVNFPACLIWSWVSMTRLTMRLRGGHQRTRQWSSMISNSISAWG